MMLIRPKLREEVRRGAGPGVSEHLQTYFAAAPSPTFFHVDVVVLSHAYKYLRIFHALFRVQNHLQSTNASPFFDSRIVFQQAGSLTAMTTHETCLSVPAERLSYPRNEILHYLRGLQEAAYVSVVFSKSLWYHWRMPAYDRDPSPLGNPPATMSLQYASEHCNRVAPFYILRDEASVSRSEECTAGILICSLQVYLFRKWFRPYRSEIEYGRYLAKVIIPLPSRLPEETRPKHMVGLIKGLNASLCAGVDQTQKAAKALKGYARKTKLYGLADSLGYDRSRAQIIRDQDNFILQPLFRAVAVAIRVKHYSYEFDDIGRMPVLIVRTGIEDGLSTPITFDSIASHLRMVVLSGTEGVISAVETDLETAVGFLMDLEQREIAAFGLRPDPLECTRNLQSGCLKRRESLLKEAELLGWNKDMQPLEGPSSNWVDTERFPTWCGEGFTVYTAYQDHIDRTWRRAKRAREYPILEEREKKNQ